MPLLTIGIFLLLSAFFSGSETAFFSLSKIHLKKLEKENDRKTRRVVRLLHNPRELLIIILIGNTIVNVAASSIAATLALKWAKSLGGSAGSLALVVEIVVMTMLLLIVGEITPKLIAFSSPEKFAIHAGFVLECMRYLLWPIIKILSFISSIFSDKSAPRFQSNLTSEDFKNLINSKVTENSLEESEKMIIDSIFRFSSITAREIMVPRVDIEAIDIGQGIDALKQLIIDEGYSKIPIYRKNIDSIIGMVYAKDIILNPEKTNIHALLRPTIFIPENVKIQNLLNQFRTRKIQFAIVVDEYGGTSGLITLEDILEELVGEILDEYDEEQAYVTKLTENEYMLNAMVSVAELNRTFNLNIDEDEYDNLADFLYDSMNKVPTRNEKYFYDNAVQFTISNIKANRINYVRMKILNEE
ncbi:MAG: HlyC/CorC family transporter [Candidatus Cloacimonetes bacterium]|nr:HlyC/CorC family transporter [Candidatus Cloacimonadota bacterium]